MPKSSLWTQVKSWGVLGLYASAIVQGALPRRYAFEEKEGYPLGGAFHYATNNPALSPIFHLAPEYHTENPFYTPTVHKIVGKLMENEPEEARMKMLHASYVDVPQQGIAVKAIYELIRFLLSVEDRLFFYPYIAKRYLDQFKEIAQTKKTTLSLHTIHLPPDNDQYDLETVQMNELEILIEAYRYAEAIKAYLINMNWQKTMLSENQDMENVNVQTISFPGMKPFLELNYIESILHNLAFGHVFIHPYTKLDHLFREKNEEAKSIRDAKISLVRFEGYEQYVLDILLAYNPHEKDKKIIEALFEQISRLFDVAVLEAFEVYSYNGYEQLSQEEFEQKLIQTKQEKSSGSFFSPWAWGASLTAMMAGAYGLYQFVKPKKVEEQEEEEETPQRRVKFKPVRQFNLNNDDNSLVDQPQAALQEVGPDKSALARLEEARIAEFKKVYHEINEEFFSAFKSNALAKNHYILQTKTQYSQYEKKKNNYFEEGSATLKRESLKESMRGTFTKLLDKKYRPLMNAQTTPQIVEAAAIPEEIIVPPQIPVEPQVVRPAPIMPRVAKEKKPKKNPPAEPTITFAYGDEMRDEFYGNIRRILELAQRYTQSEIAYPHHGPIDLLLVKYDLIELWNLIHHAHQINNHLMPALLNREELSIIRHGMLHLDLNYEAKNDREKMEFYAETLIRLSKISELTLKDSANDLFAAAQSRKPDFPISFASEDPMYQVFAANATQWTLEPERYKNSNQRNIFQMIDNRFDLIAHHRASLIHPQNKQNAEKAIIMLVFEVGELYQQLRNAGVKIHHDRHPQTYIDIRNLIAHERMPAFEELEAMLAFRMPRNEL